MKKLLNNLKWKRKVRRFRKSLFIFANTDEMFSLVFDNCNVAIKDNKVVFYSEDENSGKILKNGGIK